MKRLKIFLRLKRGEIRDMWAASWPIFTVIGGFFCVASFLYVIEQLAHEGHQWAIICLFLVNAIVLFGSVVIIGAMVITSLYIFYCWIRDNWRRAGDIARREEDGP